MSEYFGAAEFEALKSRLVMDAYERNAVSIVKKGGVWWFERCESNRVYNTIRNCMKKYFPELRFLYEEAEA